MSDIGESDVKLLGEGDVEEMAGFLMADSRTTAVLPWKVEWKPWTGFDVVTDPKASILHSQVVQQEEDSQQSVDAESVHSESEPKGGDEEEADEDL